MSSVCMYCNNTKGDGDQYYWFNHYTGELFCKRVVLCGDCINQAFEGKTYEKFLQDIICSDEGSVIQLPSTVINKQVIKSEKEEEHMGYCFCTATTTTTTTVMDMTIRPCQSQIAADGDGYIFISNSAAIDTLLQFLDGVPQ